MWLVFIYYVILLSAHGWMDVQGFDSFDSPDPRSEMLVCLILNDGRVVGARQCVKMVHAVPVTLFICYATTPLPCLWKSILRQVLCAQVADP